MKKLSSLVAGLPVSVATAVDQKVKERESAGRDVVSFCVGEPDFRTPALPCAAGIAAIRAGELSYTAPGGSPEMKAAVAQALEREQGLCYAPGEIAVTAGAKYAVYAAVAAMAEPGDEFLLPTPCWPSYDPIVRLCGGVSAFVPCAAEDGFKLTPERLRRACGAKTKALLLNNPCNPSGAVYAPAELAALLDVCRREDIYVISDEIYSALVYDGAPFLSAAAVSEDARARTVLVSGVSKSYAMTGWRIGYACANAHIAAAISVFLNHTTGSPSSIGQAAAIAALRGEQTDTERMRRCYQARRDALVPALRALGLPCAMPAGAFYVMADVRATAWPDDTAFALALLETEDVAVVPCRDCGAPGYVRLAYTLDELRMEEGLRRLARFLGKENRL